MRTKFETVAEIFSLMYDANMADSSDHSADWQTPNMAFQTGGLYGDLHNAAEKILGEKFLDYLMSGDGICLDAEGIADQWGWYIKQGESS